jgi:GrpB-like predicted nucleotidyltransferase (UPF0157 family)
VPVMAQPTNLTLIGGIEKREIRIVDYDPEWSARFRAHAEIIARSLGDVLLRIEHIGSTSVPGLAAKPIIDVLAVVVNSADEASYVPALEAAGYELRVREPDFQEHRMLRTIAKDVHVHVFSPGAPDIGRLLTFRDRLRTNAADRALYEETKRRLAAREWPDMNAYAEAKTEVVERIIAGAIAAGEESH